MADLGAHEVVDGDLIHIFWQARPGPGSPMAAQFKGAAPWASHEGLGHARRMVRALPQSPDPDCLRAHATLCGCRSRRCAGRAEAGAGRTSCRRGRTGDPGTAAALDHPLGGSWRRRPEQRTACVANATTHRRVRLTPEIVPVGTLLGCRDYYSTARRHLALLCPPQGRGAAAPLVG